MPPRGLRPKRRRLSDTNPTLLGAGITGSAESREPGADSSVDGAEASASILVQPSHVRILNGGAALSRALSAPEGEFVSEGDT